MKKKLLSTLLCVSMVASLVVGCGSKENTSEEKASDSETTTLTMWLPPLDDDTEGNFKKLLADWEKENNCTVEMELIPWANYEEKWSTGLSGGDIPDIGYMYAEMYPMLVAKLCSMH